jgi:hypothetical protein
VIGLLARSPLFIGGWHLVLVRADDAGCAVRLRAGGEYCFKAKPLARHFWQAALTRAMRIRDFLCCADKPRCRS